MKRHPLLLCAFATLCLCASSCATYKRCTEKFATTHTDSVLVEVPYLVPRDSIITSFVTDTTYLRIEERQGRATVIVERTPKITTVQAECDTVTIFKKVLVGTTVNQWGVNPWYKKLAWGFGLLWLATMLFLLFAYFFKIQIEKR
jgi:hypothetical protein